MIRKAKSIEQIYEECKNFDLVITNDAPLATALNKLVDKPRLGYFSMTPKQIAAKFAQLYFDKVYEKYEVVIRISRERKIPLKLVHHAVKRMYEMWMYNAQLDSITQFLSTEEKELLRYLKEYKTIESAMEEFNEEIYGNKKIAVAGRELFSLLDLEVLRKKGEASSWIDLFQEGEYRIDKTYIFPSGESLISNVLKIITPDNADEVAIVTDQESDYIEILKTRLRQTGIPVEIRNYLSEDVSVRQIISLIESSFRITDLKVSEFIPLAAQFGGYLNQKYSGYDLVNYMETENESKLISGLFELCGQIQSLTYKELTDKLKSSWALKFTEEFSEIIELLELSNEKITEENFLELKYYIQEFDAELESERSGVLFAASAGSAFIDRQIIFYLGLDNSWMRIYPDKEYLDKQEEEKKNLARFEILLQQGKQRFYFVRDVINYKKVIPCYYFSMLAENSLTEFSDKYFNPVFVEWEKKEKAFIERKVKLPDAETNRITHISPSSLNRFFKCPKYYSFSIYLPSADTPAFRKGNQFHEFAEFYFNHPEFVKENLDRIIQEMVNSQSEFQMNANTEYFRSESEIGVSNIIKFFEEEGRISKSKLDEAAEGNDLMKKFNKKKIYSNTEKFLEDPETTMFKGKMDLHGDKLIVDFKSGKTRKMEFQASLQSNIDYIYREEYLDFDFQAAAYIASLRHKHPKDHLHFVYNFVINNYKSKINSTTNIESKLFNKEESLLTSIQYVPKTFREYISSEEFFESNKKDNRLWNVFDYGDYLGSISEDNIENTDFFYEDILTDKLGKYFEKLMDERGLTIKSAFNRNKIEKAYENEFEPAAKIIHEVRTGSKNNTAYIFKDDLDKFVQFTKERINDLNEYVSNKFPFKPVFDSLEICKKCEFLNLCTGNKLW